MLKAWPKNRARLRCADCGKHQDFSPSLIDGRHRDEFELWQEARVLFGWKFALNRKQYCPSCADAAIAAASAPRASEATVEALPTNEQGGFEL